MQLPARRHWRLSWTERAEWQLMLAMLTLLLFSRTINISPDKVKALANSGSSGEDSGHPPGTQPWQSPGVPSALPGEAAAAQQPLQMGGLE